MPKILVTEPDQRLAADYCSVLTRHDFEVDHAATGLECLDKLRAFRPDVMLLDPDLLWGRGEAVLAIMADDPDLCQTVVVLLSENVKSKCNGAGLVKVVKRLEKPIPSDGLVEILLSLTEDVEDDDFVANWTVVEWGLPWPPRPFEEIEEASAIRTRVG